MRFAVDTGGTFTDLLVEDQNGGLAMFKAPTTPHDPIEGVIASLDSAARSRGIPRRQLLTNGDLFIHGTTHAINAILTGNTARTAFLTTSGHPDILVFREGGRNDVFNFTVPYPEPYVPRALTFEVPERVMADGSVRTPLDEDAVVAIAARLREAKIEAVAVCLLWSIVNPAHETRVRELLAEHLPRAHVTLSHLVNPSLREYRRASSACIDASLKPLMSRYVGGMKERLREEGFVGRVLMVTSQGGVMDANDVAEAPVHLINSGPAMAPIAGWRYAASERSVDTVVVADTGGTTFDVSVVRRGRIPRTRETWIGQAFRGHMTGLPSIDVKSVGAGGGSIASVDGAGLFTVGPRSAAAVPGPACYGRGGTDATVTDAALVLGYLDPDFFLGGAIRLDAAAARTAITQSVGGPLGLATPAAAEAIIAVATENMVQAIMDITVNQGIDPRGAVLVGGGGAAGFNIARIGRRLGAEAVIVPEVGAALSAAGALVSDLAKEFRTTFYTSSERFDIAGVNRILAGLEADCQSFVDGPGKGALASEVRFFAEARYHDQVWEIEVPLRQARFMGQGDVAMLVTDFHHAHEELFAVADPAAGIEIVSWSAQASCRLRAPSLPRLCTNDGGGGRQARGSRPVYFNGRGFVETPVLNFAAMPRDERIAGPAIVESSFTTIVVDPEAACWRGPGGGLVIATE
jgi:N-methylhydantoinase A